MHGANVHSPYRDRSSSSVVTGLLLIVPSLFLLIGSGNALRPSILYQAPAVVSYTDFVRQMPKSGWYTIKDCFIDVTNSVYWDENGVCIDVFAPLKPARKTAAPNPDIYVEISDPATRAAFQDMTYARKKDGAAGVQRFILEHRDTFIQRRDVSGLVSYGRRDPMGEWSNAGLNAASVTFIEDGWKPNRMLGSAGIILGIVLTIVSIGLLGRGIAAGRR